MFDSYHYFSETGINYWESGKNISQGWTGIQCPFCDDRSNHLGIAPDGTKYSCFRCGSKGHMINLIKKLENIGYEQAKSVYNKYSTDIIYEEPAAGHVSRVEWPDQMIKKLETPHRIYLKNRGFNPNLIKKNFDIRCCMYSGPFMYRILIPVYLEQRLITFIGRDIRKNSTLPYKNLSIDKSIIPAKESIYNIDNIDGTGIITEGVTDVWRLGCYNTIATFGLVFTNAQVNLLASYLHKAYIMYDSEKQAIEKAEELGNLLSLAGVQYVEVLKLSQGDPANLTQNEVEKLKKDLFGTKSKRRLL